MISRSSTTDSIESKDSAAGPPGQQVLRKTYKDPIKLREGLDRLLGEGQYTLKLRGDRYIIKGARHLQANELAELEEHSFQHYNSW